MNILKLITLSLLTMSLAFAGEAENKTAKPSVVDALYDKFVADNSKDVEKSYDAYLKSLEATNKKVIAALEAVKKDMNDPKKGKLTIQERAAAISEIDEKIAKVKEGSVGDGLVAKKIEKVDLLGNARVDLSKAIVGKWNRSDNTECDFISNGTALIGNVPAKWVVIKETISITFPSQPNWFMNLKQLENGFDGSLDDGRSVTLSRKSK